MPKRNARTRTEPLIAGLFPASRTIMISEPIRAELVARLTPKILEQRGSSDAPLGVMIDSPGGHVGSRVHLMELLGLEEDDGPRPRVITLATGLAASAAADLLVAGDLAAALPSASLHFHGTRSADEELTEEAAAGHTAELHEANVHHANWLAKKTFHRMLDTYARVQADFPNLQEEAQPFVELLDAGGDKNVLNLALFAAALDQQLPEGSFVRKAVRHVANLRFLREQSEQTSGLVPPHLEALIQGVGEDARADLLHQLRVLTLMIAARFKEVPDFELGDDTLLEIRLELDHFAQWSSTRFHDLLLHMMMTEHATEFFSPAELRAARAIAARGDKSRKREIKKFDDLILKGYHRAEPLWAFTLSVSRELQHVEVTLDPCSAWWLGLLDVVVGTPLDRRIPVAAPRARARRG